MGLPYSFTFLPLVRTHFSQRFSNPKFFLLSFFGNKKLKRLRFHKVLATVEFYKNQLLLSPFLTEKLSVNGVF